MSVTVEGNVIYRWYDIREDELENLADWTPASRKIREIAGDVKQTAIALAPVGRARIDNQVKRIKTSHYQSAGTRKVFGVYQVVVGNSAPHAQYVHQGTTAASGREIWARGKWYGPVLSGGEPGGVTLADPPLGYRHVIRESLSGSARWRAYPGYVHFEHYVFRGQNANGWLDRAGSAAYRMPGNH